MSANKYTIWCITSVARSGFLLGFDLWLLHWILDCVLLHTVALLICPLQRADQIQFHHTVPYYLQPHTDSELSNMLLMPACRALKPTKIIILYYLYTVNYVITVQTVVSYYQADYLSKWMCSKLAPLVVQSKARVSSHLLAGIMDFNPARGVHVMQRSLWQADYSFRGVLLTGVLLCVIQNPHERGGPGPLVAVLPTKNKQNFLKKLLFVTMVRI